MSPRAPPRRQRVAHKRPRVPKGRSGIDFNQLLNDFGIILEQCFNDFFEKAYQKDSHTNADLNSGRLMLPGVLQTIARTFGKTSGVQPGCRYLGRPTGRQLSSTVPSLRYTFFLGTARNGLCPLDIYTRFAYVAIRRQFS